MVQLVNDSGGISNLGIGNSTGAQPDYTFSDNARSFASRKLYVLARPGGSPSGDALVIFSHPCDREVAGGGDVTFSVNVLGDGPFSYQWRSNGVELAGQTLPWLELSAVSSSDVAAYDVVVTELNLVSTSARVFGAFLN